MKIEFPRLARNLIYLSGAEAVSKLVTFAAVAYLARVAGPVGYGYVEFAGSVLLCAGLFVDQGFSIYGAREIARAPHRTDALVLEIVFVRFLLAVVAYLVVIAFALLLVRSASVVLLLLIYGLSLLATPLLLQWVFQGHNRMGIVALMQLIRQGAFAAVVFAFVRVESQIWMVAVAEIVGVCCAAAFGIWALRKQIAKSIRMRLTVSKTLFREGLPIGLSQMFWTLRMFGATVLVGLIASAEDVGYFGAAMRILVALHAFIWLYYFNLLPSLSEAWHKADRTFSMLMDRSLHMVAWPSAIIGMIWIVVSPAVIWGVYGSAFAPAALVLQWLAGVGVIAAISGQYRFGLIAAGYQNREMIAQAAGSGVALAAIPLGYAAAGPTGTAAGLVVAEAAVWGLAWWWARDKLDLEPKHRAISTSVE